MLTNKIKLTCIMYVKNFVDICTLILIRLLNFDRSMLKFALLALAENCLLIQNNCLLIKNNLDTWIKHLYYIPHR